MSSDSTEPATAVTLRTQAEIRDNRLMIRYEVANGLDEDIYLTNRIFQWTAEGLSLDSNLVYTEIVDGTLRLVKACLPVPDDLDVESPIVPYLTHLPAGETFAETISIPLPLEPYHPYDQVKLSQEAWEFPSLQFVVGWFKAGPTPVRSQSLPDDPNRLSADYAAVMNGQSLLEATIPLTITAYLQP